MTQFHAPCVNGTLLSKAIINASITHVAKRKDRNGVCSCLASAACVAIKLKQTSTALRRPLDGIHHRAKQKVGGRRHYDVVADIIRHFVRIFAYNLHTARLSFNVVRNSVEREEREN